MSPRHKTAMIIAVVCTILWPVVTYGQTDEITVVPAKISVMPMQTLPGADHKIFNAPQPNPDVHQRTSPLSVMNDEMRPSLEFEFLRSLRAQPELSTIAWTSVLFQIRTKTKDNSSEELFLNAMELGIEQYKGLHVKKALTTLRRAQKILDQSLLDLRSPKQAAKLYLYLGLCWLERGRQDDARLAFGRMFFFQPDIEFQSGFFPAQVEESIRSAFRDFIRLASTEVFANDRKRFKRLHKLTGLDLLVIPVRKGNALSQPEVRIVDLLRGTTLIVEQLDQSDDVPSNNAVSRFTSRFVSCHSFRTKRLNSFQRKYRGSYLSGEIGYHTYANHPTRNLIHNMSIGIRGGKSFSKHMGGFLALGVLSSFEERFLWIKLNGNGDLSQRLVSLRLMGGLEIKIRTGKFTWYVAPGLEAVFHPEIQVVTSAECKFFGLNHPLCAPKNVKDIAPSIPMGFSFGAGLRYHPRPRFFVGFHIQSSLYLIPLDAGKSLDYPFTASFTTGFEL